jgi:hypothetical protein
MKLPGQAEIKKDGKTWHFYFGIDATAEFLHLYELQLTDFAKPFQDNEMKALLDMFYCALLVGDTRADVPATLTRETFGRWLDGCDDGTMAELLRAYTTSKPLGK